MFEKPTSEPVLLLFCCSLMILYHLNSLPFDSVYGTLESLRLKNLEGSLVHG
jgi:hypothetical protein